MNLAMSRQCDPLQEFKRLCRERGISLTVQRRAVFEVLFEGADHPTADEVHLRVQKKLPGLSKTTVYRVLDTLVELGVIRKTYQPGASAIYDTGTHPHHHLACLSCNKIVDLEEGVAAIPVLPDASTHGFEISESHVFFRGTCPDCLRKRSASGARGKKEAKNVPAELVVPRTKKPGAKPKKGAKPR